MAQRVSGNSNGNESGQPPIDWAIALSGHDRWLRTVVRGRIGDPDAVDDVMQEVALALIRHPPAVAETNLAPWLYTVAIRQSLLFRRRMGRQRRFTSRFADEFGNGANSTDCDPLDWILTKERRKSVRKAMAQLPVRDRQILVLKHTEGWTYQQLADHLGLSIHAVEYRLLRARKRLRSQLLDCQITEVS